MIEIMVIIKYYEYYMDVQPQLAAGNHGYIGVSYFMELISMVN